MAALALGMWLPLEAGPASSQDLAALVATYLRAGEEGAVGEVTGQAYREAHRPGGPPAPYEDMTVLLVPYSARVEAELDAIKTGVRDSLKAFVESATKVTAVWQAYEGELQVAGGRTLIRKESSDAEGRLRLRGLPAGEWLLIAWREERHDESTPRMRREDAARFPDLRVMAASVVVYYWRARLLVRPGEGTAVRLTDRSLWLTAVREETRPAGPKGPPARRHR
jgi:hypothetical protein